MKWLTWMTASLTLTHTPFSIAQATTIYIGLTYCPPPGTAPSPQPTSGVWAPYYLFVASDPNSPHQYLNDNGTLIGDVTKAAQFVFTNEGRLRSGKRYVSTNSTTSLQVFKTSPHNQSISTSFSPENGYLRWRNNAFAGREAQFCRRNNTILVSFAGLQSASCQPVFVGIVLVSSFFNQPQLPTTTPSSKLTIPPSTSPSSSPALQSTSSTITTSTKATTLYPWPSSSGAPNCVGRSIYDETVNDGFLILCATSLEGVELIARNILSFKACIESCRSYNTILNGPCVAVVYNDSSMIGNCRLLRSIRPISKRSNSSTNAAIVVDQPYAPALIFLTGGTTTGQLSSTSSIATNTTAPSSTTRSSTTSPTNTTSPATLTTSTVTVTSSTSASLLTSGSSGSNTSSYTTSSDRPTSSSVSTMTSILVTTRSTSVLSSQTLAPTSSINSTSTTTPTEGSTSSRVTPTSATTITITSTSTSLTTISSTSDTVITSGTSSIAISSTVPSSTPVTTSVGTSSIVSTIPSSASTSVTEGSSSASPTTPASLSVSVTSERSSVTSGGTATSTVSGNIASTSILSAITSSAAATTSSPSESSTTTVNVSETGLGVSTTTTEISTSTVSSSTSEFTTSTIPSTTTLSGTTSSIFTTTVTTTLASTSCPVLPVSSPLCPQRNRTKVAFSNDNICYGILCSTTLEGTIITANSSVVNNLRACAGRCALYNTAIPYGCLGVNYLGATVTSGEINCLLFSRVTAQVEVDTGGVDSIRLVYAGYSNVQKREGLYEEEDWEWPDDLLLED